MNQVIQTIKSKFKTVFLSGRQVKHKNRAFALVFFACSMLQFTVLSAQSGIVLTANPLDTTFEANLSNPNLLLKSLARITNTTNDTVRLKWQRTVVDLPIAWVTQVCDNQLCYDPIVETNVDLEFGIDVPMVLAPGQSSNLDVYITPKGVAGSGTVKILVSLLNAPDSIVAIGTYNIEVKDVATSTKNTRRSDISLYPNPVNDYIHLSNTRDVAKILVYNIVGRPVRTFVVNGQNKFDIEDLPGGFYLVNLRDKQGDTIKTVRIVKQVLRP